MAAKTPTAYPTTGGVDAACASASAAGVVTFETAGASDVNGWLLLFIDPIVSGKSGYRGL